MKLFIVATLVAVASAARLEHLERSYLPPDQGSSLGRYGQSGFGSQGPSTFGQSGSFGSGTHGLGGHGGFGSSGSFDTNGIDTQSAGVRSGIGSFPGATINQYLPPDHGPSGSNGFSGSLQGFGNGNQRSQYTPQSSFGRTSQYQAPSSQYGTPSFGAQARHQGGQQFGSLGGQQFGSQGSQQFGSHGGQQFGSQGLNSQFPAASRQYLAPRQSSNYPQQAFDEQTGYQY